jgi:subtilisin family serine protease
MDDIIQYNNFTGKGVRIALVDSGVNLSGIIKEHNLSKGYELILKSETLEIVQNECFDECGHGTCCAEELIRIAPGITVVPIKIFGDSLTTNSYILSAAIKLAGELNVDIINISAGTTSTKGYPMLKQSCIFCLDKRITIIASESNMREITYPAYLSNIIGVRGTFSGSNLYDYKILRGSLEKDSINIEANNERDIFKSTNTEYIAYGSSFATAHISGIVAIIMEQYGIFDTKQIYEILKQEYLFRLIKAESNVKGE